MEKKDAKKPKEKLREKKEEEVKKEEKGGFPEDVDFKRFLGCGG